MQVFALQKHTSSSQILQTTHINSIPMNINKPLFTVAFLVAGIANAFAIPSEEAVNKNLWLNTGGSRGALPGQQPKNPEPFRYQYDDSIWDEFDEAEYATGRSGKWEFSIENGIFGASALEDLKKEEERADLFGVCSDFLLRQNSFSSFAPEYYLRFAYAEGDCTEYDVTFAEISLGANLRWKVCDFLALSVGARAGVGALILSGFDDSDDDEGKRGFVYGGGAEAEWILNENNALVLSCDYLACTAQPDEVEKQSYVTFQLGWKYTF